MKSLADELIDLLARHSYRHGDFVLASGKRSSHYVDARQTTMSSRGLYLVGRLGLKAIRHAGWRPDLVGGLTLGADPVSFAVAAASQTDPPAIDAFTVRKEAKPHGTGRRIEGPFESGAAVVVVEDTITSGGSARRAIEAVVEAGATVIGVLAVVDRAEGGIEAIQAAGYHTIALTQLPQLIERHAARSG